MGTTTETPTKPKAKTGEQQVTVKNLLDMANGGFNERIAYEIPKILANIKDPNTDPKKARELTIKVKFTPLENRSMFSTTVTVTPKLQPTNPISTSFLLSEHGGVLQAVEYNIEKPPGQGDLDGEFNPEPAILAQIN